ncbi:hypothetical protein GJ744_000373 [Endocarpon pusillum]|uniref:Uncharacterized protein n=1 Tax=Endocarpon pusillum TaxID=364733 RepID=A0A8H7ATD1_9EURO|nr:hypothetical protein GJ744_000373 [Endocarpon pusillum]
MPLIDLAATDPAVPNFLLGPPGKYGIATTQGPRLKTILGNQKIWQPSSAGQSGEEKSLSLNILTSCNAPVAEVTLKQEVSDSLRKIRPPYVRLRCLYGYRIHHTANGDDCIWYDVNTMDIASFVAHANAGMTPGEAQHLIYNYVMGQTTAESRLEAVMDSLAVATAGSEMLA